MEEREVGGWKSHHKKVIIIQYYPDPVIHAMEGNKRFLVNGYVRGRPITPFVIMAHGDIKETYIINGG